MKYVVCPSKNRFDMICTAIHVKPATECNMILDLIFSQVKGRQQEQKAVHPEIPKASILFDASDTI